MRAMLFVAWMLMAPRLVGAQAAPSMDARAPRYTTRGVIEELRPERRQIVIRHEAVPGYMPAMTMPFSVEDASLFEGLAAQQRVEFTFSVEGRGRHVVRAIRRR
ncbi:MAG: copper-binding protein [Sandaracinus sp.]|nr:copper-binding protein [Sandaracinus sp.]